MLLAFQMCQAPELKALNRCKEKVAHQTYFIELLQ